MPTLWMSEARVVWLVNRTARTSANRDAKPCLHHRFAIAQKSFRNTVFEPSEENWRWNITVERRADLGCDQCDVDQRESGVEFTR